MVTEDDGNHTSSTLAINNLTATDSGIVQCVADNPLGVASADTTLSVLSRYLGNVMFGYPTVTCK